MITGGIEEIVKHITYFVMEILSCALCAHYNFLYYFHSYFYTQPFLYAKKTSISYRNKGCTAIETIIVFYTFYLSMCQKLKFIIQL